MKVLQAHVPLAEQYELAWKEKAIGEASAWIAQQSQEEQEKIAKQYRESFFQYLHCTIADCWPPYAREMERGPTAAAIVYIKELERYCKSYEDTGWLYAKVKTQADRYGLEFSLPQEYESPYRRLLNGDKLFFRVWNAAKLGIAAAFRFMQRAPRQ